MRIPLEQAQQIIDIAHREGEKLGKALSVAVVDAGGFIVAIARADGARPLTADIALTKAYSAAVMQRPTKMLKGWAESNPGFFASLSQLATRPIVYTEGGVTLKRGEEFLGGIGISGGTGDEDQEVADVVIAELGFDSDFAAWGQPAKRH